MDGMRAELRRLAPVEERCEALADERHQLLLQVDELVDNATQLRATAAAAEAQSRQLAGDVERLQREAAGAAAAAAQQAERIAALEAVKRAKVRAGIAVTTLHLPAVGKHAR